MSELLSISEIEDLVDELTVNQKFMLQAIEKWEDTKQKLIKKGLTMDDPSDFTLTNKKLIFPVKKVFYSPSIVCDI